MLIAVNAGNSHVRLGGYEEDARVFAASIAADPKQTGDSYACTLRQIFSLYGVEEQQISGAVISSVVPGMTPVLEQALLLLGVTDVLEVGSGLKTGLNIRSEQPRQVGSDRVACAVAARAKGKLPCVVVSLGTATTFTVLDGEGALVGSAITAGVQLSLAALRGQAAQLPMVSLDARDDGLLARNTADAMRVGVVVGAAAMVDGMIERYAETLGQMPHVVVTGDAAALIQPYLRATCEHDESLLLDGLHLIWKRNRT
ncbi:type III pantothenate kinase [Agathobaculum sp.]|uniref:type III pantothenate kinase n=1 Tax=Agathobaculum sp. TaxID=2048138 RepID=UPI002A81C644|nr:type III pantothenate kinase [Agathobaculum sp.]MDY3617921.1 type III pantothenate kinase [Agathobaculum sp.]